MVRDDIFTAASRDLAETLLGRERGRPTLSRRAGRVIARTAGITPQAGTDIFHAALVLLGIAVLARR